jgi:UrcA family protein
VSLTNLEIAMQITINNQRKSMASIIATTLVMVAAVASSPGQTLAAEAADRLTKKVTYGDLNLESQEGAKVLYSRLQFAAREVCAPFESRELSRQRAWRTCFNEAVESAVAKVNKPLVSALHNQGATRSNNKS